MSRKFSGEFKRQVVELFRQGGRTFKDLGDEFDLSATTVANWVRAAANARGELMSEIDPGGQGKAQDDQAEIASLKRQLAQKEEELEILGKALAFFARRRDQ
jgi:transposase